MLFSGLPAGHQCRGGVRCRGNTPLEGLREIQLARFPVRGSMRSLGRPGLPRHGQGRAVIGCNDRSHRSPVVGGGTANYTRFGCGHGKVEGCRVILLAS